MRYRSGVALVIAAVMTSSVGGIDVGDMFPDVGDDLSTVTWAHAVNDKDDLKASIEDSSIMMLEADVSAGHLIGQNQEDPHVPIMAHPPYEESNLSIEMWIDKVIEANQEGKNKGGKLDFKDLSIVPLSLEVLKNRTDLINFPLWLNADILKGPVEGSNPIDADKFLSLCKETFPKATLSVGWTTKFTTADDEAGAYTKTMVEEMAATLDKNAIAQPVTFPIRAAFVARSLDSLEWLLENVPDSTITVWSSASDTVDIQSLLALRNAVGHDAVYFDLPDDQKKEFEDARDAEDNAAAPTFQILPNNASIWATAGVALASALAALYLYD